MEERSPLQISIVGDFVDYQLPKQLTEAKFKLKYERSDLDSLINPFANEPDVIIFLADENTTIPPLEAAQCLRANYPEKPILYLTVDKATFEKKNLTKNGFTNAFILPWDHMYFMMVLEEFGSISRNKDLHEYVKIQVMDLHPGSTLDFGTKVYLPLNNKIHYFSRPGEVITQEKINLLKGDSRNTVLVHKEDLSAFHDYYARQLLSMGEEGFSVTERKQKLGTCVRDLVSDLFVQTTSESTFANSQQLLKSFKEILISMTKSRDSRLADRLGKLITDESDFYGHLSSVSCYAAIFAMAVGLPNFDEVGLAGLLHDIGKTNFPREMLDIPATDLSPEFKQTYVLHPQFSINICNLKRLILPDKTRLAILQHHERIDGQGYPKGLTGDRICPEAKVLAIANRFAHLTTINHSGEILTPLSAISNMLEENSSNPSSVEFDRTMLAHIKEVVIKG